MTTRPDCPIRLHGFALSGHSHRVELFLSLLGLPFERIDVNLAAGEHKQPQFIARNCFGQVPVIEDGEVTLADSNAILVYLAGRYAPGQWMPNDPIGAAQVQRWFSVAAGQLAFGPAAARVVNLFGRRDDPSP
jgi:glutathione S-transferase